MAMLSLTFLGTIEVSCDGEQVDITARKTLALLAHLTVMERAQSRERLAALLWPEADDRRARANLRGALWTLNQTPVRSWIEASAEVVQLRREDMDADVLRFEGLVARENDIAALAEAARLYRGDFLDDFFLADSSNFEDWAAARRDHYRRQALFALDRLAHHYLEEGHYDEAKALARRQIAIDNLRESAYKQLFLALARNGQRAVALKEYEALRALLDEELGVAPSPATEAVMLQIRAGAGEAEGVGGDLPPAMRSKRTRPPSPQPKAMPSSPYRGLFPFREEDAPFFFGREAFTDQLLAAVRHQALLAVVGPSGSGKSSVVYAGLVASLRQQGEWVIASFRPAARPFQALAGGLITLLEPELTEMERLLETGKLAAALKEGDLGLEAVVEHVVRKYSTSEGATPRLLLVANQFEELFTLVPDIPLRHRFLDALLDVVFEQQFRRHPLCTVVLTLRADFLGQALSYRPLADALNEADVKLGPLTRPELERAIVNPARKQGVEFAPGLVTRILDDVSEEPGNLPLLAFALDSLWTSQENGRFAHEAYDAIGKVDGALARYADAVFAELGPGEQEQARHIFIQLVQPGEGTGATRRLATRDELGEEVWPLVQRLADSRLLVTGRDAAGRETVEVVHEALIRGWDWLRGWLEEDRAFRIWQEQLRAALRGWLAHQRDESALLRGVTLATAEEWLRQRPDDLSAAERDYIATSLDLRRQREDERERAQVEREHLRRTRTWVLAGGLLLVSVLAALAGIQWWRAEGQRQALVDAQAVIVQERDLAQQALSRHLAAEALTVAEEDPILALLLALESGRRSDTQAARDSLVAALAHTSRLFMGQNVQGDALYAVALPPDGGLLAIGGEKSDIHLWRVDPLAFVLEPLTTLATASDKRVRALAFSPDGHTLAAAQIDAVSLYDLAELSQARQQILIGSEGAGTIDGIKDIAFSPDGKLLAIGASGIVQLWDLAAHRQATSLAIETSDVSAVAFTPDGERLVVGGEDGSLLVWELSSGQSSRADVGVRIFGVAVSPDGAYVGVAGQPSLLEIWQLDPLQRVAAATGVEANILYGVAFHPDGRLVSAGNDGHLVLWQVDGSELVPEVLVAHKDTVRAVAFDAGGRWLAAADLNGLVTIWNADAEPTAGFRLAGHEGAVQELAFLDRHRLTSVACEIWTVYALYVPDAPPCTWTETGIWHVTSRPGAEALHRLPEHPASIATLGLAPDGRTIVISYYDGSVILWDIVENRQGGVLERQPPAPVVSFAFDGSGSLLAEGSCLQETPDGFCQEGQIRFWDFRRLQTQRTIRGFSGLPVWLDLSPDGRWLAAVPQLRSRWPLLLWNLADEEPGPGQRSFQGESVTMGKFHPDNDLLVASTHTGMVRLFRRPEWEARDDPLATGGSVQAYAFSPDGRYLALGGCGTIVPATDSTFLPRCSPQLLVLDLETNRLLPQPFAGHTVAILSLAFSPDGSMLASGDAGGDIFLWDLSLTPEEVACRRAARNLTTVEWERYFGEEPYRETCPGTDGPDEPGDDISGGSGS